MYYSKNWKNWVTTEDLSTCSACRRQNSKIYARDDVVIPEPPIHPNCRCRIKLLEMRLAGTATEAGIDGADLREYCTTMLNIFDDVHKDTPNAVFKFVS